MSGEVGGHPIRPRVGLGIPRSIGRVFLPRGFVDGRRDGAFLTDNREGNRCVGRRIVNLIDPLVDVGQVLDGLDGMGGEGELVGFERVVGLSTNGEFVMRGVVEGLRRNGDHHVVEDYAELVLIRDTLDLEFENVGINHRHRLVGGFEFGMFSECRRKTNSHKNPHSWWGIFKSCQYY